MDNTNRLTRAEEGTLGGGSISSRKRDEQWTLNHTGNWDRDKVDLNGDGDFVDASELDDSRTHNVVNELTSRDTDSNASNNYTLTYDGSGDLTDDGQSYKYEYDAFLRLRKVKNQSNALVAEYRYNGLGHRIAVHEDTDTDLDVDANDKWYYDAFDERWRHLARFRESDSSPKEDFVPHQAGLDGDGGSSYIDLLVCRNKDANTAWTSASDGNLEERIFYCQNWRADVSVIVASSGTMKEWVKYSAYGIPFGLPGGDTDSDGDCDSTDVTQVQSWINGSQYDVRGDIDLDGDVDSADKTTINASFNGTTLGRSKLSATSVANGTAMAGYALESFGGSSYSIRLRSLSADLGRWRQRDPLDLAIHGGLSEYCSGSPIDVRDPSGAIPEWNGCGVVPIASLGCSYITSEQTLRVFGQQWVWRIFGAVYPPPTVGYGKIIGDGSCTSSCNYYMRYFMKPQYKEQGIWKNVDCGNLPLGPIFIRFWHGTHCNQDPLRWNGQLPQGPTWTGPGTENTFGSSEPRRFFTTVGLRCDAASPDQPATPEGWTVTAAAGGTLSTDMLCRCGCHQTTMIP